MLKITRRLVSRIDQKPLKTLRNKPNLDDMDTPEIMGEMRMIPMLCDANTHGTA